MKAYQLKIMIKGSHPPIWRRIVVPAGLTFSQLSIVINEVMDWCGYHLSEYRFDKLGVEVIDDFEPEDVSDWNTNEVLDAKDHKIDEFFDTSDPRYIESSRSAAKALIPFGIPFEINYGAITRGYRTLPYPEKTLLDFISENGGYFIRSSDAHSKENILTAE